MLITGGVSSELEDNLAEGTGLVLGHHAASALEGTRMRCSVDLLPLEDEPLEEYSVSNIILKDAKCQIILQ